jgi:hypothetical protein
MMTIEEYLRGKVMNYPVSDAVIATILQDNHIEPNSPAYKEDANGVEDPAWTKKRELATADLYFTMSTLVNTGGSSKQIGNRRYAEGGVESSLQDRNYWRRLAWWLYNKWGKQMPPMDEATIYDGSGAWMGSGCCGANSLYHTRGHAKS